MKFLDKLTMLCVQQGASPSSVCEAVGLTRSAYANWRRYGTRPRKEHMKAIADFFSVDVESLADDDREIVYIQPLVETDIWELSKQEKELITIYRSLSLKGQLALIQTALEMSEAK